MNPELTEITVVGDDNTGLLAQITSLLFKQNVNIEDLDQAVRDGLFRMTMEVDTSSMDCSRDELRAELDELCENLGVDLQVRFPDDDEQQCLAILVTKESHCLEILLEEAINGDLEVDVGVVIGNHPDLEPLAAEHDVPFHNVGDEEGTPDESELVDLLEEYNTDLIALARYIQILGPEVVFRYQNRIINVHPSLLPSFPGASAYMQAIEAGVRIAGVTAHYVTPDLDQGPIITQRAFNVPDDATKEDLRERGQPLEADALLEALKLHVNDEITVGRGRTHVSDSEAQLGLPKEIDEINPADPVDQSNIRAEGSSEAADD